MKRLLLTVELEYDDEVWHSGDKDPEAYAAFVDALLHGENVLHNNDPYGDTIGTVVRVLSVQVVK